MIRAGPLEKDAVPEIDMLYKHKRFKQMCILLNGTEGISSRYGYYNGSGYYNYHHDLMTDTSPRRCRDYTSVLGKPPQCGGLPAQLKI